MEVVTRADVAALAAPRPGPCISIYMPAHRGGAATEQDPIRFKNLLREVQAQLERRGWSPQAVCEFVEPATRLRLDAGFWKFQGDGLAFFLAPGFEKRFRVPFVFPEASVVSDRFLLKPLLSLLSADGRFFVLELSIDNVRLWQGSRYGLAPMEIPDVPQGLREALKSDIPEAQLQFHSRTSPVPGTGSQAGALKGGGRRNAMFHGHGTGDDEKTNLGRYFMLVDKGLQPVLRDEKAPLVLAGVDYLLPIFREASSYGDIMADAVSGHPGDMAERDLHERAWAIAEPFFQASRTEAAAAFERLHHAGRASRDINKIAPAAAYGRIETLFTALGERRWGRFDREHDCVVLHREEQPGDADLLDFCAVQTYLNRGAVHVVERARIPGGTRLAAVFRY